MSRDLYPAAFAHKKEAGQPYRPSNGTEGEMFEAAWCHDCRRYRGGRCRILIDAFAHGIDEPGYPKEWVHGEEGQPECTGHKEDGPRKAPQRRPAKGQSDLFTDTAEVTP